MSTKRPTALDVAIDRILRRAQEVGYHEDGSTMTTSYRTATMAFGGGSVVRLGGRKRFALGDTSERFTIGRRTVYFYRKGENLDIGGMPQGVTFDTIDADAVIHELESRALRERKGHLWLCDQHAREHDAGLNVFDPDRPALPKQKKTSP